jgi:hypothetical protein
MSTKKNTTPAATGTNELALTGGFGQLSNVNIADMMAEELNGLDTGFEKIRLPSAGSTVFEIPGENPEEPETVKEFSGVILYHHPLFAYYKSKYTGGSNPPDCGSFDGITGEGDPGGVCRQCRNNQFGTGENGSKACKNRRRIYILREGEIFPLLFSLPTGSLKELTRYLKRLLSKGKKSNSVVTKFSLRKATNSTGLAYSQAIFEVDRPLTAAEYTHIEKLSEQVKLCSKHIAFEYDDADGGAVDMDDGAEYPPPLTGEE